MAAWGIDLTGTGRSFRFHRRCRSASPVDRTFRPYRWKQRRPADARAWPTKGRTAQWVGSNGTRCTGRR